MMWPFKRQHVDPVAEASRWIDQDRLRRIEAMKAKASARSAKGWNTRRAGA